MICAVCLRLGRPLVHGPLADRLDDAIEPQLPVAAAAYTIANGTALCRAHFERLSEWETTDGGPVALLGMIAILHEPGTPPDPPWLTPDA